MIRSNPDESCFKKTTLFPLNLPVNIINTVPGVILALQQKPEKQYQQTINSSQTNTLRKRRSGIELELGRLGFALVGKRLLDVIGRIKLGRLLHGRSGGGGLLVVRKFSTVLCLDGPEATLMVHL